MSNIILPLSKISAGMECSSAVYSNRGVKLVDAGVTITEEILDLIIKNNITMIHVAAGKGGAPESVEKTSHLIEENGKQILKIDSCQAEETKEIFAKRTKDFFDKASKEEPLNIDSMKDEIESINNKVAENKEAYSCLAMLKTQSINLYMHSVDVAIISAIVASEFGFSHLNIIEISTCALFHDIGKMLILENLYTSDYLRGNDLQTYQKHPFLGYKLLKRENFDERLSNVIFEHHENFDGSGFPMKKYGVDSDIYSRIINVCNSYSNLLRRYSSHKAVQIIASEAKKKFDPDVVFAFQKAMGMYPNNTRVILSDGTTARVIEQNDLLNSRPVLSVIKYQDGSSPDSIVLIDLSERKDITIKGVLD